MRPMPTTTSGTITFTLLLMIVRRSSFPSLDNGILRLRSAIITRVKIASAGLIGKTKLGRFLRVLKRPESRIQESTSFHPFVGNLHPSLTPFFRREGSIAGSTQGSIRRWESTERQPTTLERRQIGRATYRERG